MSKRKPLCSSFLRAVTVLASACLAPVCYAQSDTVYCEVDYEITNDWGAGFQADITVTNTTTMPIEGYELEWDMAETLVSGWNATFDQTGSTVTASNSAGHWNGTIAADGGTASFGFQGNNDSPPADVPAGFLLNGNECNAALPPGTSTSSTSSSSSSTSSTSSTSSSSTSSSSSSGSSSSSSSAAGSSTGSTGGAILDGIVCATTTGEYTASESGHDGDGYVDVTSSGEARVDYPGIGTNGGPIIGETLYIRYSNGLDVDLPMAVYADGDYVGELTFPPTGSWSDWGQVTAVSGDRIGHADRQVSLVALSDNGGPHIDSAQYYFTIDRNAPGGWGWSTPYTEQCPIEPLPGTTGGGNQDPVADFVSSLSNGAEPMAIEFDAGDSRDPDGDTLAYSWDFDDGTTASGETTSHTFNAGVHTVELAVNDGNGGEDVDYQLVTIRDEDSPSTRPDLDIVQSADRGFAPLTVDFDASGTTDVDNDPLEFSWLVSNLDLTADGPVQSFTFEEPDTYWISMAAYDNNGRYTARYDSIVVRDPNDPACKMEIEQSGSNSYSVDVYLTNTGDTAIDGWEVWWEFAPGDEVTSLSGPGVNGNNPYFLEPTSTANTVIPPGDWVKLALSAGIRFESGIRVPEIKGAICDNTEPPPPRNQAPEAAVQASVTDGPAPLEVELSASGSSDPDGDEITYVWDFGDGSINTGNYETINHTYDEPGEYTASVTVDDGDLEDTASVTIEVTEPLTDGLTCSAAGLSVWGGGFVADILVQNEGTTTADGYHGVVTFSHPVGVNNGWNVAILPPGDDTEVPFSASVALAPGQNANFGFIGTHSTNGALQIVDCTVSPGQ